jgi:hypothetical protein
MQKVNRRSEMQLPAYFLWTRYGAEAGESADEVLFRKERERVANSGLFLWGIGNSMAPAIRRLLGQTGEQRPAVVFSPMRSPAKKEDQSPKAVARWTRAFGLDGREWQMPGGSVVTSRMDSAKGAKKRHYALVCHLDSPMRPDPEGPRFSIDELRNFASGAPVGHSQVTSLVRYTPAGSGGQYVAAVVARLVYPYVLELLAPVDVADEPGRQLLHHLSSQEELAAAW